MKIREIYKDSGYEISMKAPILAVIDIVLAIAVLPVMFNHFISNNYLNVTIFLIMMILMIISYASIKIGNYKLSSNITVITLTSLLMLSTITGTISGEQHFAILSESGILIIILAAVFTVNKKLNNIIVIVFSSHFFIDILRRILLKEYTEISRTLIQQLTGPIIIYILCLILIFNYKRMINMAIDGTLEKVDESKKRELVLKEIIQKSNDQLYKTDKINVNIEVSSNSLEEIDKSVDIVKHKVLSLNDQFSVSEDSLMQISGSLDKLNTISDSQATNIVETSAALEEMVASIKNVSSIINNKMGAVKKLIHTAENGAKVISETNKSFQTVISHIGSIKDMTSIISKISSQTNLLAMNAAIEAAHAGELGKGFAVVADEVRNLAESSAGSVKTISDTLKELILAINETDTNVKSSGSAFVSISKEVKDVSSSMEEIDHSIRELSIGSDEILTATSALNHLTTQVKDAVNNVTDNDETVSKNFAEMGSFVITLNSNMDDIKSQSSNINGEMSRLKEMAKELSDVANTLGDELNTI